MGIFGTLKDIGSGLYTIAADKAAQFTEEERKYEEIYDRYDKYQLKKEMDRSLTKAQRIALYNVIHAKYGNSTDLDNLDDTWEDY